MKKKKISLGFWPVDHSLPAQTYDCDSFWKLLVMLAPILESEEEGFYSISFFIGDRK